jgi:hypothetical protein
MVFRTTCTRVLFATLGLGFVLSSTLWSGSAAAGDLTWSGLYRVEAFQSNDPELDGNRGTAYMLHHLILSPKIIAADGFTVYGRFDILNSSKYGTNNQVGQVFGTGPNQTLTNTPADSSQSNVFSRTQSSDTLAVTELYATWVQEFGVLIAGRTPLQFGLGITHNAGNGIFDHWLTTEDVLGYKIVLGNFFILPMYGKVNSGDVGVEDDVNDYMIHVEYDNPETDLSLGIFYEMRVATGFGNDAPAGTALGDAGATASQGFKSSTISIYSKQKLKDFTIGVEAGLQSGDTGVVNSDHTTAVKLNTFGIAGEIAYNSADSKWSMLTKLGVASGDDAGTQDSYEGFTFNRNYNIGLLMFNHPLGQGNILRTATVRDQTKTSASQVDTEAVSNAFYFAPGLQYKFRENLAFGGTFVYALLKNEPFANGTTAKDLGYEVDVNVTYKPYERFTWITEAGFLFPGNAWAGGPNNFDRKPDYGLSTKAAISF